MKKQLLLLAFVGFSAALSAQANFTFTDAASNNVTGTTQNYWIDQNIQDTRMYTITNTSANSINVKVHRRIIQLNTPTAVTSFCTGINCYSPTTDSSQSYAISGSNGTSTLTSDYFPDSVSGMGHVRYIIVDQGNHADSVTLDIIYNTTPAGIQVTTMVKGSLSNPAPNPASSFFNVNYNLGTANPSSSKIIIYNMLGATVMEMGVNEQQGVLRMDVSSMENGIYFFSLISDGKEIATHRLIVAH